jgi:hypothetical protein
MSARESATLHHASDGAAYEIFLGRWTRHLAEAMLDFAGFGAAGARLDVGCGTGSLTGAMARRWPGRRIIGIDPAAARVRDRLFSAALALTNSLGDRFRAAKLGGIARQSRTMRMDHANSADYWQPLFGGQGPIGLCAAELAPALRARIEAAVRAAYLAGAPDGPRSMTATAWAVRGSVI